jgi:hypothetical protein
MSLIPERLWAQLTDEEKAVHRAVLDGAAHSVAVACPSCQHAFEVRLKLTAKVHSQAAIRPPEAVTPPVTPEDRVLDAAERSGVFDAFRAACERLRASNRPTDFRRYFVMWVAKRDTVQVPAASLAVLREDIGDRGYIELWQWGGIAGVVVDRHLRMFVPYDYLKGLSGGEALPMRLPATQPLTTWVRGRFGYVPVEARGFQEALQERSIGGFARLTQ